MIPDLPGSLSPKSVGRPEARELGIEEADQKVRELDEPWTIFPRNWFGIVLWRR